MPQPRFAAVLTLLFSFCPAVPAQTLGGSASAKEISASNLLEQMPAMIAEAPAPPEVSEAEIVEIEEGLDAYTYTFISNAQKHPPKPVNLGGDGTLILTRPGLGEKLTAHYRGKDGEYNAAELDKIASIMRCSLTAKTTAVSIKLVELLDAVEDKFGHNGLILLSGYRTPKFNGRVAGAAKYSLHMLGWAADIRIPGHNSKKVANYAEQLGTGGVGYYARKGFTHLDVGQLRHWSDKRSPPHRKAPADPAAPRKAGR